MITGFNVRLIEIPKIKKEKTEELIEYGKFTLNKRYQVYSVYSNENVTQFLVADDNREFYWIATGAFRSV